MTERCVTTRRTSGRQALEPDILEMRSIRSFEDVSHTMLDSYARLMELGMHPAAVACAMLDATLNYYRMFGMSGKLPGALRKMADEIETEMHSGTDYSAD